MTRQPAACGGTLCRDNPMRCGNGRRFRRARREPVTPFHGVRSGNPPRFLTLGSTSARSALHFFSAVSTRRHRARASRDKKDNGQILVEPFNFRALADSRTVGICLSASSLISGAPELNWPRSPVGIAEPSADIALVNDPHRYPARRRTTSKDCRRMPSRLRRRSAAKCCRRTA